MKYITLKKIDDCTIYIQPASYIVSNTNYLDKGIPVLTPGQTFVLGYTNDSTGIFEASKDNPIILFDDFTGSIQWVDFRFKVKSSACKIIKTNEFLDIRYLYYFMKYKNYSSNKHKRLWISVYSQFEIPVPTIEKQKKIINELDCITNIIEYGEKRIELYDELIESRFIELFGDPVLNPMGWDKYQLGEKCDIATGNTPSRKIPEYYGDYIEWIKSDNINTPFINLTEAVEYLSEEGLEKGRSVEAGSILMTCIAGSVKCIGNVGIADRRVAFNQQINGISPRNNNTYFMYEQFVLAKQYIQSPIKMAVKGMLNKTQLSELEFIFPPVEEQNKFGAFMEKVQELIDVGYYQLEKLKELLATEMHKCFD